MVVTSSHQARMTCRSNVDLDLAALEFWPLVDITALSPKKQKRFQRRVEIVKAYVANEPLKSIQLRLKVSSSEVLRLFRRCIKMADDGRVRGFRALLPGSHESGYKRTEPSTRQSKTWAGELTRLFRERPHIRKAVEDRFLGKYPRGTPREAKAMVKTMHKLFIELCRKEIPEDCYPFTTLQMGKRSLAKWLRRLADTRSSDFARERYGDDAARAGKFSDNETNDIGAMRPYQRTMFDGHRLNGIYSVHYLTPFGMWESRIAERPWLLLVMDAYTRAILSWCLILNADYKADDLLLCVEKMIRPWKSRPLTIPNLARNPKGGMPTEKFPELEWAIPTELWFDNAASHYAKQVDQKIKVGLGIHINIGPVRTPERRGILERLFRTIETDGLNRIPSTTGTDPKDPRRKDPEKKAVAFDITADHFEQLIDVVISNYNGTPHDSLCHKSPLEVFSHYLGTQKGLL